MLKSAWEKVTPIAITNCLKCRFCSMCHLRCTWTCPWNGTLLTPFRWEQACHQWILSWWGCAGSWTFQLLISNITLTKSLTLQALLLFLTDDSFLHSAAHQVTKDDSGERDPPVAVSFTSDTAAAFTKCTKWQKMTAGSVIHQWQCHLLQTQLQHSQSAASDKRWLRGAWSTSGSVIYFRLSCSIHKVQQVTKDDCGERDPPVAVSFTSDSAAAFTKCSKWQKMTAGSVIHQWQCHLLQTQLQHSQSAASNKRWLRGAWSTSGSVIYFRLSCSIHKVQQVTKDDCGERDPPVAVSFTSDSAAAFTKCSKWQKMTAGSVIHQWQCHLLQTQLQHSQSAASDKRWLRGAWSTSGSVIYFRLSCSIHKVQQVTKDDCGERDPPVAVSFTSDSAAAFTKCSK